MAQLIVVSPPQIEKGRVQFAYDSRSARVFQFSGQFEIDYRQEPIDLVPADFWTLLQLLWMVPLWAQSEEELVVRFINDCPLELLEFVVRYHQVHGIDLERLRFEGISERTVDLSPRQEFTGGSFTVAGEIHDAVWGQRWARDLLGGRVHRPAWIRLPFVKTARSGLSANENTISAAEPQAFETNLMATLRKAYHGFAPNVFLVQAVGLIPLSYTREAASMVVPFTSTAHWYDSVADLVGNYSTRWENFASLEAFIHSSGFQEFFFVNPNLGLSARGLHRAMREVFPTTLQTLVGLRYNDLFTGQRFSEKVGLHLLFAAADDVIFRELEHSFVTARTASLLPNLIIGGHGAEKVPRLITDEIAPIIQALDSMSPTASSYLGLDRSAVQDLVGTAHRLRGYECVWEGVVLAPRTSGLTKMMQWKDWLGTSPWEGQVSYLGRRVSYNASSLVWPQYCFDVGSSRVDSEVKR